MTWPIRSAADLFRLGAAWGHVDCAYELGVMSAQGRGVQRSPADAAKYMSIVAQVCMCVILYEPCPLTRVM